MLTSVLRVVSRAATIQLEEVAARHGPTALASRSRAAPASAPASAPAPSDPSWYPIPPNATPASQPELWEKELPPIRRGDRIDGDPTPAHTHVPRRPEPVSAERGEPGPSTLAARDKEEQGLQDDLKELEAMLGAAPEPTPTIGPDEALTPLKPSAGHTAKASPVPTKTAADRPAERDILSSAEHASTPPTAVQTHTPLPTSSTPIATAAPRSQVTADQVPVVTPLDAQTEAPSPPIDTGTWRDEKKVSELQSANPALPEAAIEQLQPEEADDAPVLLRASKVPSSKLGRLFHYGSSLSWGAASESIRRTAGGSSSQGSSVFMSDANVRRLVSSLTRMRGAALKLGQFMSIQDNNMLPPEIEKVLQQVQAHANYMPDWQMEKVMKAELGADWTSLFSTFDRTPIASASIGQVHRAVLASTGETVAVKIQFPGIQESISSDLSYLTPLLASSSILPRGLYLQNTIAVMKRELADECDYIREAESGRKFAALLEGDEYFDVPKVVDEASSEKVLTTTWMEGKPLSRMKNMSQETRDKIGTNVLRLCLIELFQFRFMQTDPNWANFLYNSSADRLGLIDFGASREYTPEFMDAWHALLTAALEGDREGMREQSLRIGYFTGEEEEVMVDAHLSSMSLLAVPFAHKGIYDFSQQTITTDVRKYIPIMLKHRLTPPPPETYSLNRKLSGAFLMCARLGSKVDCNALWRQYVAGYQKASA